MAWQRLTRDEMRVTYRAGEAAVMELLERMQDYILTLEPRLDHLEHQVKQLQGRLAQNSQNSHRPPASDGLQKPAPKSLRGNSKRRPGGQPGHPGQTLLPVEKPDHIKVHPVGACACGASAAVLARQPAQEYVARQVFELPPLKLEVTEHRAEIKVCPCCGRKLQADFPSLVTAPTQYGPGFYALLAYLHHQQLLPPERLAQLCADLLNQPVSPATVLAAGQAAYDQLAGFERAVIEQLQAAPVAHADESGLRVAGQLYWLHVLCTAQLTWFGVHAKRGLEAMLALGVLSRFLGWLVHDCWAAYFVLDCLHAICNEHLLRELKFLAEEGGEAWAKKLSRFLRHCHKRMQAEGDLSEAQFKRLLARYHAILAEGRRRHPRRAPGQGRARQSKAANLLDRLENLDICVLAFLSDPAIPFTNNQAEQDIRMLKIQQKISGCFRTLKGARIFARIRSYLSTCRKQGQNLWEVLQQALLGKPFIPAAPAQAP